MGKGSDKIRIWDPLIRVFHWTLVTAFIVAYFTDDEDLLFTHVWAGYVIIGLLVFRVLWGLVGTVYARFSNFVYSPSVVLSFLKDTLQGQAKRYLGHNPAGGWMIVLLLIMLSLISITGLVLYGADEHAGPLAGVMAGAGEDVEEIFEGLHEFFANLTLFLVIIHLAGVAMESILHKENLVMAMVTGLKRSEGGESIVAETTAKGTTMLRRFVVTVVVVIVLGGLGWANKLQADPPHQETNIKENMTDLIPLETLIMQAEASHPGRLIEAELKSVAGRDIYEIEILDDTGKVWEIYYDAHSGAPIDHDEEEDK